MRCGRWWQRALVLIGCFNLHPLSPLCAQCPRSYFFPFVCLAYVLLVHFTLTPFCLPACLPFLSLSPFSLPLLSTLTSSLLSAHPHSFSFLSRSFTHCPLLSSSSWFLIYPLKATFIQPTLTLSSFHHSPTLTHPLHIVHAFITLNNHKKQLHNNSSNKPALPYLYQPNIP